jgi:hypothetical protein
LPHSAIRLVAFLDETFLDARHHRPTLAEWIEDRREAIAGDEGLARVRGSWAPGLLGALDNGGGVFALSATEWVAGAQRVWRGDLIPSLGSDQLQSTVAESSSAWATVSPRTVHSVDSVASNTDNRSRSRRAAPSTHRNGVRLV